MQTFEIPTSFPTFAPIYPKKKPLYENFREIIRRKVIEN